MMWNLKDRMTHRTNSNPVEGMEGTTIQRMMIFFFRHYRTSLPESMT
jgi:hypothetical protein